MKRTTFVWIGLVVSLLAMVACSMPSLAFLRPEPTATPRPSRTSRPTFTPTPSDTPTPLATSTATRTPTATPPPPTATFTPAPPTDTPRPTNTPRPVVPTATFTPAPPPPTPTPANEFTGGLMPLSGDSYRCDGFQGFFIRVIDRSGKPLAGYIAHLGQDGTHFSAWTRATTEATKEPYGYNTDFPVGPSKFYVTLVREEIKPFDIGQAISNEVTVYIEPNDDDACAQSNQRNNGNKLRIAPVQFVSNR